jgi:tRNA threonylcarbamoyladenosine biosynthesis protein TsaB
MRILAIDTATEGCSAALWIDGQLAVREAELEREHAQNILRMVDELLREAPAQLSDLDAIAFGRGPGSFTGVRLAASVTQGLAFGAGLSVVPVSDLRAVAQRTLKLAPESSARILVCNDARMREVYWACFQLGENGLAIPVGEEHVSKPDAVALPDTWSGAVHGAGRGFAAYPRLREHLGSKLSSVDDRVLPHAAEVAILASVEVRAGRVAGPEDAIPVYVRDDVAATPPK